MDVRKLRDAGFQALKRAEVLELLQASGPAQEELFRWARDVRREEGLDDVTLRGVIEVSNVCRKSCDYCAMRAPNPHLSRYELKPDHILELAGAIRQAGIGVVMLQSGEHPRHEELLDTVIPVLRREFGLSVVLCMGEWDVEMFGKYRRMGADGYILKFETSDNVLYQRMTRNRRSRRIESVEWARAAGLQVGTGNMVGLPGQTLESVVDDIYLGAELKTDFISSSPFIPNPNTPYENHPSGDLGVTLNAIALYRIALRRPLIPSVSALETLKPDGQLQGLNAGANVITVNFTPREARNLYHIYSDHRFVVSLEHAQRTIERAGLRPRKSSPGADPVAV